MFERPEEEELEIRINVNEEIEEKEGVSDEQKMEDLEGEKSKKKTENELFVIFLTNRTTNNVNSIKSKITRCSPRNARRP